MTIQQVQIIDTAVDEAFKALPNSEERQLADWVMTHRYASFPNELRDALSHEGLKGMIIDIAREMGVTLQE